MSKHTPVAHSKIAVQFYTYNPSYSAFLGFKICSWQVMLLLAALASLKLM